MGTQQRPYRGYPFSDPVGVDAPSINPQTADRWRHLPVRHLIPDTVVYIPDNKSPTPGSAKTPDEEEAPPVVYIDLPEEGSSVSQSLNSERRPELPTPEKSEPDADPVVYIDLPETGGSDVCHSIGTSAEDDTFVQETIFYDPFENRRIDQSKESSGSNEEGTDDEEESVPVHRPWAQRPTFLDVGAGTSGANSSLPAMLRKETEVYSPDRFSPYSERSPRFPPSPIPVSQFPEPPPAYTEVAETRRPEEQPRTVVILPTDTQTPASPASITTQPITSAGDGQRKFLTCPYCQTGVHSLVVKQNGLITHAMAFMCFFICMLPCAAFIYCTDVLKVSNHYCPNCNKIIGYEQPCMGNKIISK